MSPPLARSQSGRAARSLGAVRLLNSAAVWLLLACWGALLAGCPFMRSPSVPMERLSYRERGPASARGAIVLLPGFGDRPSAFGDNGFVAVLARHAPDYDVFAADAHFGYYRKRTLVLRLERDVIGPLLAKGYRELWLAGTSMGGFGAIAYARTHPQRVRGVLLFAPYLGPGEVVQQVARTGLCRYREPPRPSAAAREQSAVKARASERNEDEDPELAFAQANFVWLRRQACEERSVALWLAVGSQDRLRAADDLLGAALERQHVLILPGGHGWKVWTPALERLAPLAFDSHGVEH